MIILAASRKGYKIALEKFDNSHRIIKIDPDALSEVKEKYAKLIVERTPILVFSPVGSNVIPIGAEVYVTESRLNSDSSGKFSVKLERPNFKGAPELGVPCYTSEQFVTETDIEEPVVFDRVLAFLIQDGFNIVSAWRIVSDNLSA